MNLFEKIDLFEKIASELNDGQVDADANGSEVIDNIEEFDAKASVSARRALLKTLAK
jgi:hypothetical protein